MLKSAVCARIFTFIPLITGNCIHLLCIFHSTHGSWMAFKRQSPIFLQTVFRYPFEMKWECCTLCRKLVDRPTDRQTKWVRNTHKCTRQIGKVNIIIMRRKRKQIKIISTENHENETTFGGMRSLVGQCLKICWIIKLICLSFHSVIFVTLGM